MDEEKKEEQKEEIKQETNTETAAAASAPEEKKELSLEEIFKQKDEVIADLTDKYLRALADQENYRKRVANDKADFIKYSRGEAVGIFLPVLDNFERAIESTEKSKDFGKLKNGIDMVVKQFESALKEMGVKEIPTSGIFDPNLHHAVHKEHVEGKKDGEILEVYHKGFVLDDKIIRPAMVKVAVNEPAKKEGHEHKNHEHNETGHKHNQNHDKK